MKIAKSGIAAVGFGLLLAAAGMLSACGGTDDDPAPTPLETALTGKWIMDSTATRGTVKTTPRGGATRIDTSDDTTRYQDGNHTMEFKADRTLAWNDFFEFTGNWSASGATLTTVVDFLGFKITTRYEVRQEGNRVILLEHNTDSDTDPDTGEKTQNDLMITRWLSRS